MYGENVLLFTNDREIFHMLLWRNWIRPQAERRSFSSAGVHHTGDLSHWQLVNLSFQVISLM